MSSVRFVSNLHKLLASSKPQAEVLRVQSSLSAAIQIKLGRFWSAADNAKIKMSRMRWDWQTSQKVLVGCVFCSPDNQPARKTRSQNLRQDQTVVKWMADKQKLNEPVSLSPCFTSAKLCFWQKRVTFTKRIAALSVHVCVCVCALTGGGTCSACMVFSNGVKDKGWVLHAPPLVSSKVTLQCAFESLCGYEKHASVSIKLVLTVYLGIIFILFCVCACTHLYHYVYAQPGNGFLTNKVKSQCALMESAQPWRGFRLEQQKRQR